MLIQSSQIDGTENDLHRYSFTSSGTQPDFPTGWVAAECQSHPVILPQCRSAHPIYLDTQVQLNIASDWNGRICLLSYPNFGPTLTDDIHLGGRRDCDFSSGSTDPTACLTGGERFIPHLGKLFKPLII